MLEKIILIANLKNTDLTKDNKEKKNYRKGEKKYWKKNKTSEKMNERKQMNEE